jgi:hypothetical protein
MIDKSIEGAGPVGAAMGAAVRVSLHTDAYNHWKHQHTNGSWPEKHCKGDTNPSAEKRITNENRIIAWL